MKRIDPDHPLTKAARWSDDRSDSGVPIGTIVGDLEMGVDMDELSYLAIQRARTFLHRQEQTPLDQELENLLMPMLAAAIMNGIVIGWYGHDIADEEPVVHLQRGGA